MAPPNKVAIFFTCGEISGPDFICDSELLLYFLFKYSVYNNKKCNNINVVKNNNFKEAIKLNSVIANSNQREFKLGILFIFSIKILNIFCKNSTTG